ncbi:hypothetical protein QZH41_010780 [Actinostola sp. cb2023]|nr:hypothetical protein QZH41_010780 [Actinostola sp. cb2023]
MILLKATAVKYKSIGCYKDSHRPPRPLPKLLANLRPYIKWNNFENIVSMCAKLAESKGYRYFGIEFYGECWTSENGKGYDRDGGSSRCKHGVGQQNAVYVYRLENKEGEHDRSKVESGELEVAVEVVHIHSRFFTKDYGYDVAIMKLAAPAMLSHKIGPACLPSQYQQVEPGKTCFVTATGCVDAHFYCKEWKAKGFCAYDYFAHLLKGYYCKKTCGAC